MTVVPTAVLVVRHRTARLVGLASVAALDGDGAVWRNPITGKAERLAAGQFLVTRGPV